MTVTIAIAELRRLIVARLAQRFSLDEAERMADVVLFGELAGRPSHGISRILPGRHGATDEPPGPKPKIERIGPTAARIHGSPGMLVASLATDVTIELAGGAGMAVVTTVGSKSTSGSLTYYVEQLTNAGLIGIVTANTLSFIAPPGGSQRTLGTNPIAIGVPTTGLPFVYDVGTAAISFGELAAARGGGLPIPSGVAVDRTGATTTDPAAVMDGGALMAFGGHKGFGLAMAVELLNGVLAGATAVGVTPEDPWGHVFIGISLASLGDPAEMRVRAQEIVDQLAATDGVRIPGHRSLATRDASLARGTVDVDAAALEELRVLVG
ncbi:MAG: Ldh family oxidoreductase [Acidimicrobiia bacterium]